MKKIGVIINPNARKIRNEKGTLEFYRTIKNPHVDLRITSCCEDVDSVLDEFKRDDVDYLGVAGGDGTLHNIVTRAILLWGDAPVPPVVILKGGTMDNVSRSIHLPGKGPAILKRLIHKLENGEPAQIYERNTMKIEGHNCFIFGNGVITNFLNEVYKYPKGWASNSRIIAKTVHHAIANPETGNLFSGIHAEVYVDNKRIPFHSITGILAGSVEHISFGLKPMSRATEDPGCFNAIILGLSGRQILRRLYPLLLGLPIKNPLVKNVLVQKLTIKSKWPFQYTMDGDMFDCQGELSIELGKKIKLVYV